VREQARNCEVYDRPRLALRMQMVNKNAGEKYLISVSGLYPNALLRQVQAELSEFVTNAIPPAPTNISFSRAPVP
jgi:hypothetical protein